MKLHAMIAVSVLMLFSSAVTVMSAERPQKVKSPAVRTPAPAPVPAANPAPAILSIIPAQAEPGGKVTMFGSGFGAQASAYLGSIEVAARVSDGKQAEFSIPQQVEPGLYALYLKRSDGTVSRPYNFTVMPQRPQLNGLSPDLISSCAQGAEREVTARGQNFLEASQLVFDGAVLKSRFVTSEAIVFSVPRVSGGLHQVAVRNSPDNSSVAIGLMVETKPEITEVMIGARYVNYYELIVTGKNFQQNSAIFVDGVKLGGDGGQNLAEREKLIYVDCTRLIYQRHPYSNVNKDFSMMVVNPDGESSQAINVSVP